MYLSLNKTALKSSGVARGNFSNPLLVELAEASALSLLNRFKDVGQPVSGLKYEGIYSNEYIIIAPEALPTHMVGDKDISNVMALADPWFLDLATEYLSSQWGVNRLVLDRVIISNSHAAKRSITEWHLDQQVNDRKSFKIMAYLSDVGVNNGAFTIIPYFTQWYKKLLVELNSVGWKGSARDELWRAEQLVRICEKFGFKGLLHEFQVLTHGLDSDFFESSELNEFKFVSPKGGFLAFDPKNLHRGSVCEEGNRLLVRFHYFEEARVSVSDRVRSNVAKIFGC